MMPPLRVPRHTPQLNYEFTVCELSNGDAINTPVSGDHFCTWDKLHGTEGEWELERSAECVGLHGLIQTHNHTKFAGVVPIEVPLYFTVFMLGIVNVGT
jgi:hypothetical protein